MATIVGMLELLDFSLSERDFTAISEPLRARAENGWCKFISDRLVSGHSAKDARTLDASRNGVTSDSFLAWDGRLDNKMELLNRLVRDRKAEPDLSEEAIIASTISSYGISSLVDVLGDWALSFWDNNSKTLLLARDFAGMRPLYYRRTKSRLIWSSDLEALLNFQGEEVSLNHEYLAGLFAYGCGPILTPFTEIRAIPPGHALVVAEGKQQFVRFWALDERRHIRYKTDAEYEEHFRDIFYKSVRDRLQSSEPVFCELSGGIDSTSIASVATLLLREGVSNCPGLETISHIYDNAIESDESSFIHCAEGFLDCRNHYLLSSEHSPLESVNVVSLKPSFSMAFAKLTQAQTELMKESGAATLLCGIGGDEIMCNAYDPTTLIAGELRRRHFKTALSTLCNWSKHSQNSIFTTSTTSIRLALGRESSPQMLPGWMTPKAVGIVKPLKNRHGVPRHSSIGYNGLSASFWSCLSAAGQDRHRPWPGITTAYPFLDRRLIEFCAAIPLDQLARPGESRSLQRRALRGIIPEKIRLRKTKRNTTAILSRSLDRLWESLTLLLEDSLLERIGWSEPNVYRKDMNSLRQGVSAHISAGVTALMIERWYRDLGKSIRLRV